MLINAFANIKFLELNIQNYSHNLYKEERSLITKASLKRINEFSTGRYGIRCLLKSYGINYFPITHDQKGMPIFPNGIIGSISHTDRKCCIAMSTNEEYRSIGVDIEEYSKLNLDLCKYFLHKKEIEFVYSQMDTYPQIMAAVLFSAKEAFYKMQYSISKTYLDFLDVETTYIKAGILNVRLLRNVDIDTDKIKLYYNSNADHVYTIALNEN